MGQGENKIARSLLDIQPSSLLEFYRIYPNVLEKPNFYIPFHNGSLFEKNITWQGIEYIPLPIESEGFEIHGTSKVSRPKIRIANKDYIITALLQNNEDFIHAKVVRKRTFLKYIDNVNFDGGNPFGQPDSSAELSNEEFIVCQKTAENKLFVELELTSPLDIDNFEITSRKILSRYCYWQYRGPGCNYAGLPLEQEDGKPFTDAGGAAVTPNHTYNTLGNSYAYSPYINYKKGEIVYIESKTISVNPTPTEILNFPNSPKTYVKDWYICILNNINKNPQNNPKYWQRDGCQKTLGACKKRFNATNTLIFVDTSETRYLNYLVMKKNTTDLTANQQQVKEALDGSFSLHFWFEHVGDPNINCELLKLESQNSNNNLIIGYNRNTGLYSSISTRQNGNRRPYDTLGSLFTYPGGTYYVDSLRQFNITGIMPLPSKVFSDLIPVELKVTKGISGPHNYLRWSEDFLTDSRVSEGSLSSDHYWNISNIEITPNSTTAPNGTNTASLLKVRNRKEWETLPLISFEPFITNLPAFSIAMNEDVPHPARVYRDLRQENIFSIHIKKFGNTTNQTKLIVRVSHHTSRNLTKGGGYFPTDQLVKSAPYAVDVFELSFSGSTVLINNAAPDNVTSKVVALSNGWFRVSFLCVNRVKDYSMVKEGTTNFNREGFYQGCVGVTFQIAHGGMIPVSNTPPNNPTWKATQDFYQQELYTPKDYELKGFYNYYQENAIRYYNFISDAASNDNGIYVWGWQLHGGNNLDKIYYKSTERAYIGNGFDLSKSDKVEFYGYGGAYKLLMESSGAYNQILNGEFNKGVKFGLGADIRFLQLKLFNKPLNEFERQYLMEDFGEVAFDTNTYTYYPVTYKLATGRYPLLTQKSVFWSDINRSGGLFLDETQNKNHLSPLGSFGVDYLTGQLEYFIGTLGKTYNWDTSLGILRFGGFPGTDDFGYAYG
jgi:lambda family phage minor tail protein L